MTFSETILAWYKIHKRSLPWRVTKDPYKIWISEIMLQQTRIEQGLSYYHKFIDRFPDIKTLASASEKEVLKLWQGLGYYSRARNMHITATMILDKYNGILPSKYEELIKLKGVGNYTAAAIASIAFNEPVPVVDGNVLRFLSRYKGFERPIDVLSGKKEITAIAINLMDKSHPGDFNQAMMEFGALVCKPKNPDCEDCTFKTRCQAFRKGLVKSIPIKTKSVKIKKRYFHYLVITYKKQMIYLKCRSEEDIWKNLYDFPLIEKKYRTSVKNIVNDIKKSLDIRQEMTKAITVSQEFRHILTHQEIITRFYTISLDDREKFIALNLKNRNQWESVKFADLLNYPVPRLVEKFFFQILIS